MLLFPPPKTNVVQSFQSNRSRTSSVWFRGLSELTELVSRDSTELEKAFFRLKKFKKYVTEKGVESDSFRCLAASDCGLLHNDTKFLLKSLAQRSGQKYETVRDAFQLEIEKFSAYTVVSQLRDYIPDANWVGGMKQ